jgi:hypothetical protein
MSAENKTQLGAELLPLSMLCMFIMLLMLIVTLPFAEKMLSSLEKSGVQEDRCRVDVPENPAFCQRIKK